MAPVVIYPIWGWVRFKIEGKVIRHNESIFILELLNSGKNKLCNNIIGNEIALYMY